MSATSHNTIRLTMAQALVRYLSALRTEEGVPLFGGAFAIFGHGNVAGLGEALYQYREQFPTYRAHNEQAMAHAAIAYAKAHMRRRMLAVTSSIGPGATNLLTAAPGARESLARAPAARRRVRLARRTPSCSSWKTPAMAASR
jgi:3D-(3,5/4)-trihydroxycyclohexane-1,2-dione acylhydrolase (decyclizing)